MLQLIMKSVIGFVVVRGVSLAKSAIELRISELQETWELSMPSPVLRMRTQSEVSWPVLQHRVCALKVSLQNENIHCLAL